MLQVSSYIDYQHNQIAEDTERIKKEEEEVKQLSKMYETVYLTKKKHFNHDSIAEVVTGMKAFIPQEHWDEVAKANQQQNEQESKTDVTTCGVCFCEFDDVGTEFIIYIMLIGFQCLLYSDSLIAVRTKVN